MELSRAFCDTALELGVLGVASLFGGLRKAAPLLRGGAIIRAMIVHGLRLTPSFSR